MADKHGNDGADVLAVAGAELHAVDKDIVAMSTGRREIAKKVHDMFIAIVRARREQEHCLNTTGHEDVGDRGSDPGDCQTDANDDDYFIYDEASQDMGNIPLCMGDCHASPDDVSAASGTELVHVSDNESLCHGNLYDECDEGAGTYFGVVQ